MAKTTLSVLPLKSRAGLRLAGDVDLATVEQLREALDHLNIASGGEVHLELGDLHFIDAAGARALIHHARTFAGRRIVLHDPPYALRRIIDVLWGQPGYILVDTS